MSEVHAYLEKAARSLDAAGMLLANGDADFAASRAYYGCFYVAESLLFDEGLSISTHAGVIGEYGRLFAKTERLDRRFHRLLQRTFTARHSADYDANADLNTAEVHGWLEESNVSLDAAREYLQKKDLEYRTERK